MDKDETPPTAVKLTKQKNGGLGILVRQSADKPCLVVSHVVQRGPAGQLKEAIREGDSILAIDGKNVAEYNYDEVLTALSNVKIGSSVELLLERSGIQNGTSQQKHSNGHGHADTNGSGNAVNNNNGSASEPPSNTTAGCPFVNGGPIKSNDTTSRFVKLKNLLEGTQTVDTLHRKSDKLHCTASRCMGSFMEPYGGDGPTPRPHGSVKPKEEVERQARDFIDEYYASQQRTDTEAHRKRIDDVVASIRTTGTYHIEENELIFGAKLAWRNASRCIGRIQWSKLQLFDYRHVTTTQEMFEAICNHLRYATNKGKVRSTITVFPARVEPNHDFRVWNPQYLQYAGYKCDNGSIIGDPNNVELTELCESFGWKPPRTPFDFLPLILQADGKDPDLYEIPSELAMTVKIRHPKYKGLDSLGLQWYVVPAVSGMLFDVGGIEFPGAPFNGWYMATEVSARNFSDSTRYNKLKEVAKALELDTSSTLTMWKDRAIVELTYAVMNSYNEAGATMMDHHTAAETFMKHLQDEQRLRGGCPADWVWIVPPVTGAATPVFHQEMLNYHLRPSYEYQELAWKRHVFSNQPKTAKKKYGFKEVAKAVQMSTRMMGHAMAKRNKVTILYASETGKSEGYAKQLQCIFSHAFDPKVVCMKDYEASELEYEQLVLVVTSTFGNGEAPENGELFGELLFKIRHPDLKPRGNIHLQKTIEDPSATFANGRYSNMRFSVFGLGSRAYPNFCAFAHSINKLAKELGGECIYTMGEGDELCGQEESFRLWAKNVYKEACSVFCVESNDADNIMDEDSFSTTWAKSKFQFSDDSKLCEDEENDIAALHGGKTVHADVISVANLQHPQSGRSTNLVKLSTKNSPSLKYQPGDHLAIFPCNDKTHVERILSLVTEKPAKGQEIKIDICRDVSKSQRKCTPLARFPPKCTLEMAFKHLLDITSPPAPSFLGQLAALAADPDEQTQLHRLAEGGTMYEDWKYEKYPSIVEVLLEFPSVQVPALFLLTQLPLMKSRYYSISSSPLMYTEEIHITVAVVNYRTLGGMGPLHKGVCSTWLDDLRPGDKLPCFVRTAATFHLPEDRSAPIILVGPGTGIAPLRSFWQHRHMTMQGKGNGESTVAASDKQDTLTNGHHKMTENGHGGDTPRTEGPGAWGSMKLYFGCRNAALDNIYGSELNEYKENGSLTEVHLAFSREPGQPKTYVQKLLENNGQSILDDLVLGNGHMYVCGDVSMAADVARTLQTILERNAAMSQQEAQTFIEELRADGRYHEDIFGITLRLTEVTDRVRTAARKAWVYLGGARRKSTGWRSMDSGSETSQLRRSQTVDIVV